MKDAINYTYGFGCHCRNCESCVKGTAEDNYWSCSKDILKPGAVNNLSFCSVGKPKTDTDADFHHDISAAIVKLREDVTQNDATEGYFDVKLKNGKDIRIGLDRHSEDLEVSGLTRNNRRMGDIIIVAMLQDEVEHIDDIRIWKD